MFCPKHFHEEALKRIGRYLKLTQDHGLILNPNRDILNVDSYPYTYFSGTYGHDNPTYPVFVKSRTNYIIKISYCPVLWQPKLHTETALLTTEAECFALDHNCRYFPPVIDMTKFLGKSIGLPIG